MNYNLIKEYCQENYKDIIDKKIKASDEVLENTFLFDMPWDLERTTEAMHYDGKIDWLYKLNGDPEFTYQLNRHRYCVDLAESYIFTGNVKYAEKVKELLLDWIENVPCKEGSLAWRTLETGLRGEYWTQALDLLKDSGVFSEEDLNKINKSLLEQAKFLVDKKIDHHRLSNWGVLQDHGLLDIAIELNNKEYIDIALDRLYEEARLQALSDGMHWEVSATYHNEVLMSFMDAIIRCKKANIEVSEEFKKIVHKMALVDLYWLKPDKTQPLYGDSDVIDLRDNLALCATIFKDGMMKKVAGDKLGYHGIFALGDEGLKEYEALKEEDIPFTSVSMDVSGNYVLRESFDSDSNYLMFHNSHTGGGHAHEDKLSFELAIKGKDVLVDCGRYTYVWNKARADIKSYKAHNTTCVDNKHFVNSLWWDYIGTPAESVKQDMVIEKDYELVKGAHLGYLNRKVYVSRNILWIKPNIYIILDEFRTNGRHKYSTYYNFSNEGKLALYGDEGIYTNGDVKSYIKFVRDDLEIEQEEGQYSHHYNAVEKCKRIKTFFKDKGNAHNVTVIVGDVDKYQDVTVEKVATFGPDAKTPIDGHKADALVIKLDNEEYTVIFTYDTLIKSVVANGKRATGRVTYYKDDEYHIIRW